MTKATEIRTGTKILKNIKDDVETVPGKDMALNFTITSERTDRDGDIVRVDGMEADDYLNNPVVMFGHNYMELPIARTTKLWKARNGVKKAKARFEFIGDDVYPKSYAGIRGSTIYEMARKGFISATSIGFEPLEFGPLTEKGIRGTGTDFTRWSLLEISVVPVPSNASALMERGNQGHDSEQYRTMMKAWVNDASKWCTGARCEPIYEVDKAALIAELNEYAEAVARVLQEEFPYDNKDYYLVDLAEFKTEIDAAVAQIVQEAQEAI